MSINPRENDKLARLNSATESTAEKQSIPEKSVAHPAWRQGVILAAIPLLTLIDAWQRNQRSATLLAGACLVFLLVQRHHASKGILRTSVVLFAITAFLLPAIKAPAQALESGVRIGGLIASLLISVGLLSKASLRVPRMRQVITDLFSLPRSQRPLALGIATQFLGGFLGLAGLTMMMDIAAQRSDIGRADQIADFSAISRGYAALSLWSPMYSNMSIVLALYGGVRWSDLLPCALAIAAFFIGLGAVLDALKPKDTTLHQSPPTSSVGSIVRQSFPIVLVMLGFVALLVFTSNRLHIPISVAIICGAPAVAWMLNARHQPARTARCVNGAAQLGRDLIAQTTMTGEVMLFLSSGCAGTVLAEAIPASWSSSIAQTAIHSTYLSCLLIIGAILLLSCTAIHPMLSAILVGSSFSPALLGLPPLVHLCAVLVGWGLSIIATPFSVLSILASRFSGIPILIISLRANMSFVTCAVCGAVLALGFAASVTLKL